MPRLVSVVIPTHNYGRFLGRAVKSVLTQTYSTVECIVVDDGSTDETPEVLASFVGSVTVVRQAASGPSSARNAGLRVARGAYVAFLDADDEWMPEKLQQQVSLLEDAKAAAVGCGIRVVSADGRLVGRKLFPAQVSDPIDVRRQLRELALRSFWVGGSASGALVRREVLDEVGGWDAGLRVAEDWDLWLRIGATHVIRNLQQYCVAITVHHQSSAWHDAEFKWQHRQRAWQQALARWPDDMAPIARKMQALIYADCGGEHVEAGQTKQALARYLASLRFWPLQPSTWRAVVGLSLKRLRGV
jgi:glycosyltransferase involved in cell wall biosynthesis